MTKYGTNVGRAYYGCDKSLTVKCSAFKFWAPVENKTPEKTNPPKLNNPPTSQTGSSLLHDDADAELAKAATLFEKAIDQSRPSPANYNQGNYRFYLYSLFH